VRVNVIFPFLLTFRYIGDKRWDEPIGNQVASTLATMTLQLALSTFRGHKSQQAYSQAQ
jgi:hypothetical protein